MIIHAKKVNFVKPTKKMVNELKFQIERYNDKRYYLTKVKRKGRWTWGLKMFKRARQIEYFKRKKKK